MKKLFIVLLLVALVPFTVGCNGLFSNDSDGSDSYWPATTLASKTTFSTTVTLPSGTLSTSIRAAVTAPTMVVGGVTITGTGSNPYTFTHVFNTADLGAKTGDKSVSVPYTISYSDKDGNRKSVSATANITVATSAASDAAPTTTVVIKISDTGVVTIDGHVEESIAPAVTYQIDTVTAESMTLTNEFTTAKELRSLTPTFTLSFATNPGDLTNIGWTVKVYKLDANGTAVSNYELTKTANASLFSVADNGTVITVADDSKYKLTAGTSYKVELVSTTSPVVEPMVVYFKTTTAAVVPATLNTVTVNETPLDITAGTTEVASQSSTVGKTIVALTLNNATSVTAPADTDTATVTIKRTNADNTVTTMSVTLNKDNSAYTNGTLTLTFPQELTSGGKYEVSVTGTWTNVTVPTTAIKFVVK